MNTNHSQNILLESGTNEMEIIEFYLDDSSFGINVLKTREIIVFNPDAVTTLPGMPPAIPGTLLLRGKSIMLIDLKTCLGKEKNPHPQQDSRQIVLVCELNERMFGLVVDGVNKIHRTSWESISPIPEGLSFYKPRFTGSLTVKETIILLIDIESILAEYDPSMKMESHGSQSVTTSHHEAHLMLAEDSSFIRNNIRNVLEEAGYDQIRHFADGEECYHEIIRLKKQADKTGKKITDFLNLLITDIEMPKMDGLTLCRKIKQELGLSQVKVVIFSSMINSQMASRCEQVGADAFVTKPELPRLLELIDGLLSTRGQ